nr:glycoside hydrolase family 3 C-terminal domain-containing protein [Halanaerobacter jeridensis]
MTVEEKIKLLSGGDAWHTQEIESVDIPNITLTDGPHGVRLEDKEAGEFFQSKPATSFPIEAAMAASWNQDLIEEMGQKMGEECQYYDVGVLLGPGVNGKRSPLAGRNFEYFSEDPYLSGKIGASFVKGVQSEGVGTSVKHYVANEQETNRMVVSSEVDERTLREIYLLPFEMIVKEANPWTMMCAYNKVNGTHMSQNKKYLVDVLKDEWGYEGLIMSDWGAVSDKVASIKAGLDLEMPGPGKEDEKALQAFEAGELTIEEINARVKVVLELVEKVLTEQKDVDECDFEQNHKVARKVAEESMVLLKNEADILPLAEDSDLAVLGKFAQEPRFQGGGSSQLNPYNLETPLAEIKKHGTVDYAPGYEDEEINEDLIAEACEIAQDKDKVIIFAGTTEKIECEGYDRKDISIPESHIQLIKEVAKVNQNIVVVTNSGAAIDIEEFEAQARGIVHAWLPGQAGGSALANILFAKTNPSGKLSETFPIAYEHNPTHLSFPGDIKQVEYKEEVFVGYRYYDAKKLDVKYPFGFGLSYTEFEYSNLELSKRKLKNGEGLVVSADIKNTGDYAGQEVVQLYVKDHEAVVRRPEKELKGFTKVHLEPGESKRINIKLDERDFSFYSEKLGEFAVESGQFDIMLGSSSRDIRAVETMEFDSNDDLREPLTVNHSIEKLLEDERTGAEIKAILDEIDIDQDNNFYSILLGMPLTVATGILRSFNFSEEKIEQLAEILENTDEEL